MTGRKPDPAAIDDEAPELTGEWFAEAGPASELLPAVFGLEAATEMLRRHPGRRGSQKAPTKVPVSIRLSPDVVAYFKSQGEGWQRRIDEALRSHVHSVHGGGSKS